MKPNKVMSGLSGLMSGTSLVALSLTMLSSGAYAQQAPQAAAAAPEEIVVTGSRLTTGFETPTPVTVMSADALQNAAPTGVADALAQMPALANTLLSNTPVTAASGTNGQSLLNLRNLGANRNLVLLDGKRTVATNQTGTVDINTLPTNLISHIDVVTGGASAAYGSDAVAGVVNFALDTKFVGLKGDVGGGISSLGDMGQYKGSLAWGDSFIDDRLHVIASTQYFHAIGIPVQAPTHRSWWDNSAGLIANPGAGPTNITAAHIRSAIGSDGGVITANSGGPAGLLKGIQFLENGQPAPFNYGTNVGSTYMDGGDGTRPYIGFSPDQTRSANFLHAEFDLTDNITPYVQGTYSYAYTHNGNEVALEDGSGAAFTIFSGNPYIPASIQNTMTTNGIKSFTLGRYLAEYPVIGIDLKTRVNTEQVGVKGRNPFGLDNWRYDVSYTNGTTIQYAPETNLPNSHNIYAQADVVVDPNTGKYVCRSTIYNSAGVYVPGGTGLDTGCIPINPMGLNTITDKNAQNYGIGTSWKRLVLNQRVAQGSLSGDLGSFALPAGPISVAVGAEYREETAAQTTDILSQTATPVGNVRGIPSSLQGKVGEWRFYNPLPFSGAYNVVEGFGEVGIPLLADLPFVKSLNADLAVRNTDYSVSGDVTTWKAGGDYQIIDDIRLRGTVSRDIRAPNLLELFNASTQSTNTQQYPCTCVAHQTIPAVVIANLGNPNLKPESALTLTYGAVLTPTFLPGFSLSADYYRIKINGYISSPGASTSIDNCYNGLTSFCSNFVYTPPVGGAATGTIVVYQPGVNYSANVKSGWDFEAQYKTTLFDNPLSLHLLANTITTDYSVAPLATPINSQGTDGSPSWRMTGQVGYKIGAWFVQFQERYISPAKMSATLIQGISIDNNRIPAYFISDLTVNYDLDIAGSNSQLYLTINNLFNRAPPPDFTIPTSFSQPTNRSVYDGIGQYFNFGIRFKL